MTDKEKLEKIVAYLKRRMYAHNQMADIGSTGEIFDEKIEKAKYEECRDTLNFIDTMYEESKECMYSTANYTNADRLTLCKDCKELCRYNQKTAAESLGISQEAYDEIVDKCLYSSEVELVDDVDLPKEELVSDEQVKDSLVFEHDDKMCKENGNSLTQEPVSEDLESFVRDYREKYWYPDDIDKFIGFAKKVANWQKQQMMKKAFSAEIGKQRPDYKCVLNGNFFKYDTGDKVKLIIIEEE